MVPGMTERDRHIADAQLLDWLADARLGPTQLHRSPDRNVHAGPKLPGVVPSHWRREFHVAFNVGRRPRLTQT
jgi:hypothetical protein